MIFSREYIGYLARRTVKHLIDAKMITTSDLKVTESRVTEGLIDELSLEDRINEEVRVILDAYSDEMRKTGAQYAEMFKKVKTELARKSLEMLLTQEAAIDTAARQKIASQRKIILEGSQEWEILYRKYYNEEVRKLGI